MLQSDFQTRILVTCVRCLEDFLQPLHTEFTELYAFPKDLTYDQPVEDQPEFLVPENGYIDLAPLLREYLLLEIPIKPLHRPDCRGLCPICGTNWNHGGCVHQTSPSALFQLSS